MRLQTGHDALNHEADNCWAGILPGNLLYIVHHLHLADTKI